MPAASQSPPNDNRAEGKIAPPRGSGDPAGSQPRLAFRAALARYKGARLAAIRLAQGAAPDGTRIRPVGNADEITDHLDQPAAVEALAGRLETGPRLALSADELVHYSRPAIDVLFQSAADAYGPGLLGVVLTGANTDGAQGLAAVQRAGGLCFAQSPETALAPTMPEAALKAAPGSLALTLPRLAELLSSLKGGRLPSYPLLGTSG